MPRGRASEGHRRPRTMRPSRACDIARQPTATSPGPGGGWVGGGVPLLQLAAGHSGVAFQQQATGAARLSASLPKRVSLCRRLCALRQGAAHPMAAAPGAAAAASSTHVGRQGPNTSPACAWPCIQPRQALKRSRHPGKYPQGSCRRTADAAGSAAAGLGARGSRHDRGATTLRAALLRRA